MIDTIVEALGFLLIVLAIGTFSIPIAVGVAGAGLILYANRPRERPKPQD